MVFLKKLMMISLVTCILITLVFRIPEDNGDDRDSSGAMGIRTGAYRGEPNRTSTSFSIVAAADAADAVVRRTRNNYAKEILIMSWTVIMGKHVDWLEYDKVGSKTCANVARQCRYSYDKDDYDVADLVMFHMFYVRNASQMPMRSRPEGQLWLSYYREAPTRTAMFQLHNVTEFNVTMSYSRSTDITVPYSLVRENKPAQNNTSSRRLAVLWYVSNCRTPSKRNLYAAELARHIPVQVYGACGDRSPCTKFDGECERDMYREYYFYLSFENSVCDDYITEKVWNRLHAGIVPVVMGGGDYARDLPPNSYIDVARFGSPAELAAYLHMLMGNPDRYAEYHAWRENYDILKLVPFFCTVCEYMNQPHRHRSIADIRDEWSIDQCTNYENYYKGVFDVAKYLY